MHALLVTLSDDPRANLTAGLYDRYCDQESSFDQHTDKATGVHRSKNPRELPKEKPPKDATEKLESQTGEVARKPPQNRLTRQSLEGKDGRYAMLSFSNTDMAFSRDTLVAGNYHGFNIYDISAKSTPS